MDGRALYSQYIKPSWTPPTWVIGLVWPFLYVIIAVSYSVVFYSAYKKLIPRVVALPFALNLIFNFVHNTRSGYNEVDIVFAGKPLLNNFHVQEPQETATEARFPVAN